jgi:polyisoprenoid-binding protein YceI
MSRISLALLACLTLSACESELDNKPAAAVEAAPAAPAAPAPAVEAPGAAIPAGAVALSPSSHIEWVGAKVTKDHPGGFKSLRGHAQIADGAVSSGQVVIDVASLYSDAEKLTKHLKDPDFFDLPTFPTATFSITSVQPGAAPGATHTVTGTLDLHGVKKEIAFPATVTVTDGAATIAAEFLLNRKDFGMAYAGKADDLIRDEVLVKGELQFGG